MLRRDGWIFLCAFFFSIFFLLCPRRPFFFYQVYHFSFQRLWRCNSSIGVLGFRCIVMNWICPKIVMYLSACGDYTYNVLFGHHAGRKVPVIVTLMAWNDPGNTGRKRHRKRCRSLYLPGQRNSWILSTILTKKRRKWVLKKGQELTSPFHSKKFDNAVLKYLCKLCLYGGAWRLVVTVAMFSVVYLFICWKVSFATFRVYEESTFNFFYFTRSRISERIGPNTRRKSTGEKR